MMINGFFYDGITSKPHSCQLFVGMQGKVSISGLDDIEYQTVDFETLVISSRVGKTVRAIRFVDGARFETQDNDAVDAFIKTHGRQNSFGLNLHQWESKLKMIVVATVITGLCLVGFVSYGIPAASNSIAHKLPYYVSSSLAQEALDELDGGALKKSDISINRQTQLTQLLEKYIPTNSPFSYRLLFRKSSRFGANALALPDGTIIITDELLTLTDNNEEILSVLLHEIGHIEKRHSLRNVVESFGLYAMYSWMTGDVDVSSVAILAGSGILLKARYSRGHESEADNYSLKTMLANDIDPNNFAIIMQKLDEYQESKSIKWRKQDDEEVSKVELEKDSDQAEKDQGLQRILDYLSSHPASSDRIEAFKKAAKENGYPK